MNFHMSKLVLEKVEEQLSTSTGSSKKQKSSRKNIYFCFINYSIAFDCVDHNKLWKILKEMGIPDNLTCLLRNVYAGQEATVRTGNGTTDCFQIGKGLYIVTLLICTVRHQKPWAGRSTSWNQDCRKKYQ